MATKNLPNFGFHVEKSSNGFVVKDADDLIWQGFKDFNSACAFVARYRFSGKAYDGQLSLPFEY